MAERDPQRQDFPGADDDRGRFSKRPGDIPRAGWRDILLRTKDEISQDDIGLIVAGVAFYGLLAVFPGIAALISVYGLIADPAQVQQQFQAIAAFVPEGAQLILSDQMTKVSGGSQGALGLAALLSLLLALWSASRGTRALMLSLNVAYKEKERRGFIALNLGALALTLFLIVLGVVAIGGVVVVPAILELLAPDRLLDWLVTYARWPVMAAVLVLGLSVLYRFGPCRRQARWRWITPGSVVSVALWLVASVAFSVYVRNFASYNETYGSIGAVIAMMMWLWLSVYIVVLGAELNAETERQTREDSTIGRSRSLGERGAHAADTVGEKP